MVRRWGAAAAATLALLAGLAAFAIWFATFDDGGIRRGDLAYYVFIPSRVRGLPAIEPCDEPQFSSRTNDSLEAEVISMEYSSRSTREDLHAAYAEELVAMRCESEDPPAGLDALTFQCADPKMHLTLHTGEPDASTGCRPVVLEFRY